MASVYRPRYDDDPNPPSNEKHREKSPRRNGRHSPSRDISSGQTIRKADRSENRSRSPDRRSPLSGTPRIMSELEKRRREYDRDEREIRIKEVAQRKKEIEYKEREKRKREVEDEEREIRAKEAAIYKKSLSVMATAGAGEARPQQSSSRPILRDIHSVPQTDRDSVMEYPERRPSLKTSHLDTETRPQTPNTGFIGPSDMESKRLETRTSLRLHIAGLLTRFTSEVTEQAALQLRRDSAKKTLDQKTADYEKAQVVQIEFPSAAESTKASKERAQREYEKVEKELSKKQEASLNLAEEIAEYVIPIKEPSNPGDPGVAGRIVQLDESLRDLITEVQQRKQDEDTANLKSQIDELSLKVDGLQDLRGLIEGIQQRKQGEDTADLKSTMDSLLSRVEGFEIVRLDLSKAVETINGTLAVQSAAINDRSEIHDLHISIKALSRSEGEIRARLGKFQTQVLALEKELRAVQAKMAGVDRRLMTVENDRRPSESNLHDTPGLSNEVRVAIHDEIKVQQAAVDGVFNEKLGSLEERLGNVTKQSTDVDRSLATFLDQYAAQVDRIAVDLAGLKGDINSSREEVNVLRREDFHSLQLAYGNLDYRMNNLSTEHLARQILGQLDAYIRGSKENFDTLEYRIKRLEERAMSSDVSTMSSSLRGEVNGLITSSGLQIRQAFIDMNKKLADDMKELQTRLNAVASSLQIVRDDVDSSKASILETLSSLRTEVGTTTSKLQAMQEDLRASKIDFMESTNSLRAEMDTIGSTLKSVREDLSASKTNCKETAASLRVEIAKIAKTGPPEKRRLDSPAPTTTKTNGHKRRRARMSASDSDDNA